MGTDLRPPVELPKLPLTFIPEGTVAIAIEGRFPEAALEPYFQAVRDGILPSMLIIELERGAAIRALSEADMREAGWVRG